MAENIQILLMSDKGEFEPSSDLASILRHGQPIVASERGKHTFSHGGRKYSIVYYYTYQVKTPEGVHVKAFLDKVELEGPSEPTRQAAEDICSKFPVLYQVIPK